ncbi:MAG: hypothetical protein KA419_15250, partial [Acidobacteria bacterium]|nr:hypothetical protein [Acidobacteriota bacterium]
TASPTAPATPAEGPATSSATPEAPKKSAYSQTKDMDWTLTPERRAAIEAAIPEAKGFVDGMAIVKEVVEKQVKGDKARVKLFLSKAKGKYIYFAAQVNPNPFNDNASLNLIFSEEGLMPDFLMVQMVKPKDLDTTKYKERYGDSSGYVSPFVGKLGGTDSLTLDPSFDLLIPGIWK